MCIAKYTEYGRRILWYTYVMLATSSFATRPENSEIAGNLTAISEARADLNA